MDKQRLLECIRFFNKLTIVERDVTSENEKNKNQFVVQVKYLFEDKSYLTSRLYYKNINYQKIIKNKDRINDFFGEPVFWLDIETHEWPEGQGTSLEHVVLPEMIEEDQFEFKAFLQNIFNDRKNGYEQSISWDGRSAQYGSNLENNNHLHDVINLIKKIIESKGEIIDKANFKRLVFEWDKGERTSLHPYFGGRKIITDLYENIKSVQNELDDKTITTTKMSNTLNQILYGPPGTGKTYHTIDRALQIIDLPFYEFNKFKREEINKRFKDLMIQDWESGKGQIAFCTFHQSMSYEDFIEGIKPLEPKVDDTFIRYDIVDGIFKKICKLASTQTSINGFDESYQQFVNDMLENNNFLELKTRKQLKPFTLKINTNQNVIVTAKTEDATEMTITKEVIKFYLSEGEAKDWKPYSVPIAEYIRSKYPFSITTINHLQKPCVLIVDEINRGNVSQIFGELITLIEENKRAGRVEELKVILPYSKKLFSVPSNVYIIGTMNTADRSVEALDTALRRRFSFEFMPPDSSKIDEEFNGIPLREIFIKINERISFLLDKDHQIGHSYLMNVPTIQELKEVFKNKIIPLLKEYFFNDYRKIHLVLGDGFVKKENTKPIFAVNDNEEMARDIYTIVSINESFNIESELIKVLGK